MNVNGTFVDKTVAAHLDTPVQCGSVTAGDFDNDMYVDLYLACRTGASNIANILYHNNGDGTFTAMPNAGGATGPVGLAIADGAGEADSVVTADYDVDGFLDLFVTNGFNSAARLHRWSEHAVSQQRQRQSLDRIRPGRRQLRSRCHRRARLRDRAWGEAIPRPGWPIPSLVTGLKRIHFGLASATSVDYGQVAERRGADLPERARQQAVQAHRRRVAAVGVGIGVAPASAGF